MTHANSRSAEVGARIKLARERISEEPSAAAFARRVLDVDASALWRWENGSIPNLARLEKLAPALGTTVGWLLTGEGKAPAKKKRRVA